VSRKLGFGSRDSKFQGFEEFKFLRFEVSVSNIRSFKIYGFEVSGFRLRGLYDS
jgi:hypothetical protein